MSLLDISYLPVSKVQKLLSFISRQMNSWPGQTGMPLGVRVPSDLLTCPQSGPSQTSCRLQLSPERHILACTQDCSVTASEIVRLKVADCRTRSRKNIFTARFEQQPIEGDPAVRLVSDWSQRERCRNFLPITSFVVIMRS